jgi:MazG family protein
MTEMQRLLEVMTRLRDPESGCPWDAQQTYDTIAPYTIEEAYEVADAIARSDMDGLKDELGDLLFQVVFYAQMAQEQGEFAFPDVATAIVEKMIRRHPHVFADTQYADAEEQSRDWDRIKAKERAAMAPRGVLDGVPVGFPGLTRAVKLQRKAARVGFDWQDHAPVIGTVREELAEIEAELATGADSGRMAEEVGDLLFACANLARHLGVDPEAAVRGSNAKFEDRFGRIEGWLAEAGMTPAQSSLAEMDALWERAKAEERGDPPPNCAPTWRTVGRES